VSSQNSGVAIGQKRGVPEDKLALRPKFCPRTRPRAFVLGISPNLLFWPRENECIDGTGNHYEFAMIIYQSYLLTYLVLLI